MQVQLCEKCLKAVISDLHLDEQAAIIYVMMAQKDASGRKQKFLGVSSTKMQNIFKTEYAYQTATMFLIRLGLMNRDRSDHTFTYSLTRDGQKVGTMILSDEKARENVNAFFVIGKEV